MGLALVRTMHIYDATPNTNRTDELHGGRGPIGVSSSRLRHPSTGIFLHGVNFGLEERRDFNDGRTEGLAPAMLDLERPPAVHGEHFPARGGEASQSDDQDRRACQSPAA